MLIRSNWHSPTARTNIARHSVSPFVIILFLAVKQTLASGWLDSEFSQYSKNNHNPFQSLIDAAAAAASVSNSASNSVVGGGLYMNKPMFSYVGCFNDRRELRDVGDKDYTFITKFNKSIPTVELCVLLCAQDGYSIAGIQAL